MPEPISGNEYLTSTQAKYVRNKQTDMASEPDGLDQQFFSAYNKNSVEPTAVQLDSESDSESDSDSSSDSDSDDELVMWHVAPDYGELDDHIMSREHDIENGKKESGWTNPLGWTDDGHDDDLVVL